MKTDLVLTDTIKLIIALSAISVVGNCASQMKIVAAIEHLYALLVPFIYELEITLVAFHVFA